MPPTEPTIDTAAILRDRGDYLAESTPALIRVIGPMLDMLDAYYERTWHVREAAERAQEAAALWRWTTLGLPDDKKDAAAD